MPMVTRLFRTFALFGVAAALGIAAGIIYASGWTDTQNTTGNITVASTTPDILYICEAPIIGGSPPCTADDTLGDEVIFEIADEALLPGGPKVNYNIVLYNPNPDVVVDIIGYTALFTETFDPGSDCTVEPAVKAYTVLRDDDHQDFGPAFPSDESGPGSNAFKIHIGVNGSDEMRIEVWIPSAFPIECQGGAWDLSIDWTAEIH